MSGTARSASTRSPDNSTQSYQSQLAPHRTKSVLSSVSTDVDTVPASKQGCFRCPACISHGDRVAGPLCLSSATRPQHCPSISLSRLALNQEAFLLDEVLLELARLLGDGGRAGTGCSNWTLEHPTSNAWWPN